MADLVGNHVFTTQTDQAITLLIMPISPKKLPISPPFAQKLHISPHFAKNCPFRILALPQMKGKVLLGKRLTSLGVSRRNNDVSCCLVESRMAESERLSVHGISLQRHSSEVVGNTRRCPEGCCCCVVLYRHSKLLGCYRSPVLGLNILPLT